MSCLYDFRSARCALFFLVTTLAFGIGCGDDDRTFGGDTGGQDTSGRDTNGQDTNGRDTNPLDTNFDANPEACEKMDILFVIDDSGSMGEEQTNLIANFPQFVTALDEFVTEGGSALDYRLGVTTTGEMNVVEMILPPPLGSMTIREDGPNGALLMPGECNMSNRWISRGDANVSSAFSCVANVGTRGSSKEKPLLMTQRAITDRVADGSNAGFLRNDALLAVVMLTDEDDCSGTSTTRTIDISDPSQIMNQADECDPSSPDVVSIDSVLSSLDTTTGGRERWAGAIIAGPTDCTSSFGDAAAATRLQQFANEAGDNVIFSSICEGDLAGALTEALQTFDAACDNFVLM